MDGQQKKRKRTRAISYEQKLMVRDSIIAAGEKLFETDDPEKVSLRRIAAAAGYSPGTIYQYFSDQQELFLAVREKEIASVNDQFERICAEAKDPAEKVRRAFVALVQHWRANFSHWEKLVSLPPNRPPPLYRNGTTFAQSAPVVKAFALYEGVIRELFDTYPRHPMPVKLATDSLFAAIAGVISYPIYSRTRVWSDATSMAEVVVESFLRGWVAMAAEDPGSRERDRETDPLHN